MDGGRFVKMLLLLGVFLVEMILGAPKCTGPWANSVFCRTGNGKRSDIGLAADLRSLRRGEGVLPGFESPEQEEIGGRTRIDDGYVPRQEEEDLGLPSYGGRQINPRGDSDYAVRRERLMEVLIRRLLKKDTDYED